jgi:hypothetical protein
LRGSVVEHQSLISSGTSATLATATILTPLKTSMPKNTGVDSDTSAIPLPQRSPMQRILFITKKGQKYSEEYGYTHCSSGLKNSARFVVDMLRANGVDAKLVDVIDNNDIDREVFKFKPDIVIIEALWVIPEKFSILKKLHPKVKWVVRIHSEVPFLATEGIAIKWIIEYLRKNVFVAFNSLRAQFEFMELTKSDKIIYLPNFFPTHDVKKNKKRTSDHILNVGCFGAIRPMKNQLMQALAAIRYAELHDKFLVFHINASRVEQNGEPVLENIRALFKYTPNTFLVEHSWLNQKNFHDLLQTMDLNMCVSLSETFCIVAAESVALNVPLVCSEEVHWANKISKADPTSMNSIVNRIEAVLNNKMYANFINKYNLNKYDKKSINTWLQFVK